MRYGFRPLTAGLDGRRHRVISGDAYVPAHHKDCADAQLDAQ